MRHLRTHDSYALANGRTPWSSLRRVRVPFVDLKRQTAAVREQLDPAIARVLSSGWFVLGNEGAEFEREFAHWVGTAHAAGAASGTDAIELAVRATGIGPGDEVVTQANTCVPTVTGIERAGATVVLCDVDAATAAMDPASLAAAIGLCTRAVVVVHLYGQCGDVDAIERLAGDQGLTLIEDCAQAHGAAAGPRRAGTIGAAGCFSFYPTKNLGALGDGGAVVTGDPGVVERMRRLRTYGQTDRYRHDERGLNSRLDEIQAAILRAKLPLLDAWTERRRAIAARYDSALEGTVARPVARVPGNTPAYHLYVVAVPDRPAFQQALEERGVSTLVHYPLPIHHQPAYRELAAGPVPLTASEELAGQVVSLPLFPELTDDEVEHVAAAAREAAQRLPGA